MTPFRLMLVTDSTLLPARRLPHMIDAAVAGGVDAVQMRERTLTEVEATTLGRELRDAIGGRALLLVNGSAEIATACAADGVHLQEIAPAMTPIERDNAILGRSVHSVEAARRAESEGCDYVVLGTIFPSRSHPGAPTGGLVLIEQVARAVRIPVIGIGGITAENAADVIRAGASGVAVISAILAAVNPRAAAAELRHVIDTVLAAAVGERE